MKIYKLTQILSLLVFVSGCQKGSDGTSLDTSFDSNELGAESCQTGSSGIAVSEAKILGTENLISDQKTLLSLDNRVNCIQAEKAQWSVGNVSLGKGSQIQATIKGTGIYYIQVNASNESANSPSTLNSKVSLAETSQNSVRVAVTDSKVLLLGSQVGVEFNSYTFSLVVPNGVTLKTADWDFGAGLPLRHSLTSESKSFQIGTHTFTVVVTDTNDKVTTLKHTITILPLSAGLDCTADELATIEVTGPTQVPMSEAFDYALYQPNCIKNSIAKLSWSFGDGSAAATTSQVEHTYAAKGDFKIVVGVWLNSAENPTFTVSRDVNVIDVMEQFPGPGTPTDPNACVLAGSTRTIEGPTSTQDVTCGLNGTRTNSYQDQIVQICQGSANALAWVEQSRTRVLVLEGACQSQSCKVGDKVLTHGQSTQFYRTQTPANLCSSVLETRICTNGVLSGSASAVYSTCNNGCGDFGIHGTVKVGVVVGSISKKVNCSYGEDGIYDVYSQLTDQTCTDGQVVSSNKRDGDLKEKGLCPSYSWVATDNYTACSADCGGKQTLIYACRDNRGADSDEARCDAAESIPVQERVCDGNPEAVRKVTSTSEVEEANSSIACPKNQIGVIVNDRTVTTTVTVACIDHQVNEESRQVTVTPWVSTSYCRNLVPKRCSQDSLSNAEAAGRYDWMVKCQFQVPIIKEFLEKFSEISYKGISLDDSTRHLYPTFLNSTTNKTWVAPKSKSGSCTVPATAYVAAVCVSSCATPEQEIIGQVENNRALRKVSFIEAFTKNLSHVGTLKSNSTLQSKALEKTEVDIWVTELLDTTQPVITFTLKSGGHLKVTPNHPLLNKFGMMQLASEFKVSENLVLLGGRLDPIVSIETADYYGKVYNLFVKSNDLKKNVVVINGYLSGTAFYQNEGTQYMNRDLFRHNLTRGVFIK